MIQSYFPTFLEKEWDVINAFYALLQNHMYERYDLDSYQQVSSHWFKFPAQDIKKFAGIGKNDYVGCLENICKGLREKSIILKNYKDPTSKKIVRAYHTSVISEFKIVKDNCGYRSVFDIRFSELFILLCLKEYSVTPGLGNFTTIDIAIVRKIRKKHAKRVYEILCGIDEKFPERHFKIDEFQRLLSQVNKAVSETLRTLERCKKDLADIMPFCYCVDKYRGVFILWLETRILHDQDAE